MSFWREWGQAIAGAVWISAGTAWLVGKAWDRWMR